MVEQNLLISEPMQWNWMLFIYWNRNDTSSTHRKNNTKINYKQIL